MRSTKRQTVTSSSGRSFLQANLRFRGLKRLKIFRPRRGGASRPARPGPVNINIFEFATCLVKVLHFFRALPPGSAQQRPQPSRPGASCWRVILRSGRAPLGAQQKFRGRPETPEYLGERCPKAVTKVRYIWPKLRKGSPSHVLGRYYMPK
jgi:hypothetical protein